MSSPGGAGPTRDEAERLDWLRRSDVLDSDEEREFDDIVALAARLCEVPISTITLVDEGRQWFKASVGLDVRETPRAIAFCAHAIQGSAPLMVPDALLDARFVDNPLVTGDPHLRFYAGFPLSPGGGATVGTLTVMDRVPRRLDAEQVSTMTALAYQAAALLELRLRLRRIRDGEATLILAQLQLEAQVEDRSRQLERTNARLVEAERLYRSLWETTTDAVLILDEGSHIRYANPGAEAMFGHAVGDLVGQPLALIQPERLRAAHVAAMQAYLRTGERRVSWRGVETVGLHATGAEVPLEISFSQIEIHGRLQFVGFIRDISERKRALAALLDERERAQSTLRSIGDGVITTDVDGRIVSLNPMAERLIGWTQAEAASRPAHVVLELLDEQGARRLPPLEQWAAERGDGPLPFPPGTLLQPRHGPPVSVEGSLARLTGADARPIGWVVALRDVSQARRLAAQVEFQATHDELTGLVNRSEFDRRLRAVLDDGRARAAGSSLLYLDLDQFKIVNDTCGHIAGDELLKQLAGLLALQLDSGDTLARLGGDEFGVLMRERSADDALRVARSLLEAVGLFVFTWQDQRFATGISIGHVHFSGDGLTATDILSRADEACYVAKDLGRNRIHSYQPGDELQARRHGEMRWVGLIREALEQDRFVLHGQPIVRVAAAAEPPQHVEVLLRMRAHDGSLIPPMDFLPAAERYDLMPRIDRWVVRAAIAAAAEAVADDAARPAPLVAINLSGATLCDAGFAPFVRAELARAGVPASRVCFEITETAAIANLTSAVRLINELKALGCRFSLDDFGSGLSSFAYLKHLPVDLLKIDGVFVRTMASDPVDRAMVASINEIGHVMGLETIAEFVENDAILAELRAIGVDYAQGYALGAPQPLAEVLAGAPARIAVPAAR
ncbi:EAL domain-containing protein [Cognatilysobacter tabacisoli]|uniref:EAL domain-containing protein n=1 Tax=Cognatilysobacter tabacisoli TaxID=2315424 RepID=UPI0013002BF7|nr:EAL domain-containing protein [Lysobacter tabacisoli]